jgi:peptidoglycan/LPS O-acetylase OafA/YrhL
VVERIRYLDGVRGIGALIIFLFHFVLAFPTNLYVDLISSSAFNILFDGRFAVCLFFVLSGFVLTYKFFLTGDPDVLVSSALRRYFRFFPTVVLAVLISYLFMVFGIYLNVQAAKILGVGSWIGIWNNFPPNFTNMLKEAFIYTLFGGGPWNQYRYLHTLWTMSYELAGSFIVLGFAALFGKLRGRCVMYLLAVYYSLPTYYLGFIIGMVLADYHANRHKLNPTSKLLGMMSLTIVILLGLSSLSEVFYNTAKASLIILIVLNSASIQGVLSNRILLFLGRISFSFYVLHLIILFSFSSTMFIWMHNGGFAYDVSVLVVLVCTLTVLTLMSLLFQRLIDDKSIQLSRMAYPPLIRGASHITAGHRNSSNPRL